MSNTLGKNVIINPPISYMERVEARQGSQIIRMPDNSIIRNLILGGGASSKSNWAGLKGAVVKVLAERQRPVSIDGGTPGFFVPSAFTLTDGDTLEVVRGKNPGIPIPSKEIVCLGTERFVLIPSVFCHPDELFLKQGTFADANFSSTDITNVVHMRREGDILYLREAKIVAPQDKKSFDILEGVTDKPTRIIVQLQEGGHIILR